MLQMKQHEKTPGWGKLNEMKASKILEAEFKTLVINCLLYTSDAADE